MPSLEALLLATIHQCRSLLVLCLPVLQFPPRFGLSTSGVRVAVVVSSSQRLPGRRRIRRLLRSGYLVTGGYGLLRSGYLVAGGHCRLFLRNGYLVACRWMLIFPQRLPGRLWMDAELSAAAIWSLTDGC